MFKSFNNPVMAADGDLLYVDSFFLGFRKMAKVCMMKSWLECLFLCADVFQMGFLLFGGA